MSFKEIIHLIIGLIGAYALWTYYDLEGVIVGFFFAIIGYWVFATKYESEDSEILSTLYSFLYEKKEETVLTSYDELNQLIGTTDVQDATLSELLSISLYTRYERFPKKGSEDIVVSFYASWNKRNKVPFNLTLIKSPDGTIQFDKMFTLYLKIEALAQTVPHAELKRLYGTSGEVTLRGHTGESEFIYCLYEIGKTPKISLKLFDHGKVIKELHFVEDSSNEKESPLDDIIQLLNNFSRNNDHL